MDRSGVGWFLFATIGVIMLVITFADKSMDVLAKVSVVVSLLIIAAFGWAMQKSQRGHKRDVAETWQALAKQTGLTFENGSLVTRGIGISPSLRGEYRDHYISMTLVVERSGGDNDRILTQTSLMACGDGSTSLEVRGRSVFDKIIRRETIPSGNQHFDRAFLVKGSPLEFVRRALRVILRHKTILLTRTDKVTLLVLYPLAWTSWVRPSIKLEKAELVCLQHGVVARANTQKKYLDLLCDLADLVEAAEQR